MSFSQLLRKSKVSSYTPAIDQIYTATAASGYGLKRPVTLPSPSSAPFIRVNSLDSIGKKTLFRKGTREVKYTQKWSELDIGIASDPALERKLQSSYIQNGQKGGLPLTSESDGKVIVGKAERKVPNYFKMEEVEFQAFLTSLEGRREEFKTFLLAQGSSVVNSDTNTEGIDLFAHAQAKQIELSRVIEKFLAIPSTTTTPTTFNPLPTPHPTLGLQYSSPTDLESFLSPPLPGRLLTSDGSNRKGTVLATILGQVTEVSQIGSNSVTTWFPDEGPIPTRSNIPGRTQFKIRPTIEFKYLITQLDNAAKRGKVTPTIAGYNNREIDNSQIQSQTLAGMVLNLNSKVYDGQEKRHPVGSQEFTGTSLEEKSTLSGPNAFNTLRGLRARDLSKSRYSGEEKREFRKNSEKLFNERAATGPGLYSKKIRDGGKFDNLLASLDGILEGKKEKK